MLKKDLLQYIQEYYDSKSILERMGDLFSKLSPLQKLQDFAKRLPDETLSHAQILELKSLIAFSDDQKAEAVFKKIRVQLKKEEKLLDFLLMQFIQLLQENHYYDRTKSLINSYQEIKQTRGKPLSNRQAELTQYTLALLYAGVSFGTCYYRYVGFFTGRLVSSLSRLIARNLPQNYNLNWYSNHAIAFATACVFDIGTASGGSLALSYTAGTILENFATKLFNWKKSKPFYKNYASRYPATTILLQKITEDIGFFLGAEIFLQLRNLQFQKTESPISAIDSLCPVPPGSFVQTCPIEFARSYPLNIADQYFLCVYTFLCKQEGSNLYDNKTFALPAFIAPGCLTHLENCNTALILRPTDKQICNTTSENISKEVTIQNAEFNQPCEHIQFQGSYNQSCPVTLTYSIDLSTKEVFQAHGLAANAYCLFKFRCNDLSQKNLVDTVFLLPKIMKNCLRIFENCDGQLVQKNNSTDYCTNSKKARDMAQQQLESYENLKIKFMSRKLR